MCLTSIIRKNIDGIVADLASKISALAANLYKNYYTKTQVDAKLTTIDNTITNVNSIVTSNSGRIITLDGKITALDSKATTLDNRITTLENTVKNLPTVTAVTPEVNIIDTDSNNYNLVMPTNTDKAITSLVGRAVTITPTGGNVIILDLSGKGKMSSDITIDVNACNKAVNRNSVEFTLIINAGKNNNIVPTFDSSIKFDDTPITSFDKNKYYEISINTITGLCLYKKS